jgi:hypothetical protein
MTFHTSTEAELASGSRPGAADAESISIWIRVWACGRSPTTNGRSLECCERGGHLFGRAIRVGYRTSSKDGPKRLERRLPTSGEKGQFILQHEGRRSMMKSGIKDGSLSP